MDGIQKILTLNQASRLMILKLMESIASQAWHFTRSTKKRRNARTLLKLHKSKKVLKYYCLKRNSLNVFQMTMKDLVEFTTVMKNLMTIKPMTFSQYPVSVHLDHPRKDTAAQLSEQKLTKRH